MLQSGMASVRGYAQITRLDLWSALTNEKICIEVGEGDRSWLPLRGLLPIAV